MNTFVGRRASAALACAAVVLLCAALAPRAHAQGYSVYANCERSDGWTPTGTPNIGAWRDCAAGWLSGMKTYVIPHNDGRTDSGTAAHVFHAPAGTRVTGLRWDGHKYYGVSSAGWIGGGWAFRTGLFGDGYRSIDPEADCFTHNLGACYSGAFSDPNPRYVASHDVGGLNEQTVGFYTQCVPSPNNCPTTSDGLGGHNLTRAALVVSNMRVDLWDQWDPTIKGVGGSMLSGDWTRGAGDITLTADDNSGICNVAIRVRDVGVREDARPRDSYALKPCGDLSGTRYVFDTSGWGDGVHSVYVTVGDAAGRTAESGWYAVNVDNTPPEAPRDLSIDGGEGWQQSNSRTIRWTNPSQAGVSPIAGSQVQVCRTGTSDCRTVDAGGGGVVSGIGGFAGPGDYTVRVSLRDRAGNHNPGLLSNGVRLRFDNLAPGEAEATQSNGWLNAVERAAYRQSVKLADGAFKPVSGIQGYSITRNASDPDSAVEAYGETVDYPINDLPEGVNTVKARAVSGAGVASATVRSAVVRIDLSKPTASVEGAPDPAKWQGKPVDLVLRGTDQAHLSGMAAAPLSLTVEEGAYIAYRVDGGELQRVRGGSAPLTVGDEGEHTVTYYAVDLAGNQSDTQTVHFKIDRTSPTASAVSDAADAGSWQRESVTVTLTGDDGAGRSGMDPAPEDQPVDAGAHLAYRLDTGEVQRMRGPSAAFRVDADGDHAVTYYAVDGAGNESERREVRFRIDKTAPARILFEEQGADRRRLEVAADDDTSGVGEVQIGIRRVGGVPQAVALRRLAKADPARFRRTKLRGTRRAGNRLVDCRRKRGTARRRCVARRRKQLVRHRIAPLGSGWTMLPAVREGDRWVAYVPDDGSLRMGTYQLQAVVQDQAGNEASGDRFRDGAPGVVTIAPPPHGGQPGCCQPPGPGDPGYPDPSDPAGPGTPPGGGDGKGGGGTGTGSGTGAGSGSGGGAPAAGSAGGHAPGGGDAAAGVGQGGAPSAQGGDAGAAESRLTAGAVKRVKLPPTRRCRKPRTSAQRKRCKPRYRQVLVKRLRLPYGKRAKVTGSLTTPQGAPIADGTVDVVTTAAAAGHSPRVVGAVTTDRSGAFTYTAPAGSSRKLTFRFRGRAEHRPSEGSVDVLVRGAATFRSSARRVANGQSVTFSGRLLGKPLPARGKVVDLQVFYRGRWRTFATPRANRKGSFRFRYRFEATRTTTTYRFRARVRPESAYPYELGYSKVLGVTVRGG